MDSDKTNGFFTAGVENCIVTIYGCEKVAIMVHDSPPADKPAQRRSSRQFPRKVRCRFFKNVALFGDLWKLALEALDLGLLIGTRFAFAGKRNVWPVRCQFFLPSVDTERFIPNINAKGVPLTLPSSNCRTASILNSRRGAGAWHRSTWLRAWIYPRDTSFKYCLLL